MPAKVAAFAPDLLLSTEHHLCPGCGEPVALRLLLEALDELELVDRSIGVVGIGCYTQFSPPPTSSSCRPARPRARRSPPA